MGQSKGLSLQHLTSKEIEEKLSELLNHEIIDPVLRVWRVYRFVAKKPDCDRYLVCSINRKGQYPDSKTGLKPGVTKLSRYVLLIRLDICHRQILLPSIGMFNVLIYTFYKYLWVEKKNEKIHLYKLLIILPLD